MVAGFAPNFVLERFSRTLCLAVVFALILAMQVGTVAECSVKNNSQYNVQQCYLLHISDSMDALEAVRHTMFTAIIMIAVEMP